MSNISIFIGDKKTVCYPLTRINQLNRCIRVQTEVGEKEISFDEIAYIKIRSNLPVIVEGKSISFRGE